MNNISFFFHLLCRFKIIFTDKLVLLFRKQIDAVSNVINLVVYAHKQN